MEASDREYSEVNQNPGINKAIHAWESSGAVRFVDGVKEGRGVRGQFHIKGAGVFKIIAFGILFAAATNVFASETAKYYVPVYVSAECENDSVGQRLVYKVREALRRSASMRVADTYAESIVQSSIVCLTPKEGERGVITRYSHAVTFINSKGTYDYQLTHGVGICGSDRVDNCADDLVASIDSAVVEVRGQISSGKFKPFDP